MIDPHPEGRTAFINTDFINEEVDGDREEDEMAENNAGNRSDASYCQI